MDIAASNREAGRVHVSGGGILSKKFWGIASAALPLSSFYILVISGFLYFLFFTLCQIFRESV